MLSRGERQFPAIISLLKDSGYHLVNTVDLPEEVSVFQGGRFSSRGFQMPRYYAVYRMDNGTCVIGWPNSTRLNGHTEDGAQVAIKNCLGRVRFMSHHPDFAEGYLQKIYRRFSMSIVSQTNI